MTAPTDSGFASDVRQADLSSDNPAVTPVYEDYFGFGDSKEFVLPDGLQKIFFEVMNEGKRSKFQKKTSKDIKFNRASGDAAIKADQAEERHELLMSSVIGWSLKQRQLDGSWVDVPFTTGSANSAFAKWLEVANPKIVDDLEFQIRLANPWMQAEQTVEEIDKELERLQELREQAVERERGKSDSSTK